MTQPATINPPLTFCERLSELAWDLIFFYRRHFDPMPAIPTFTADDEDPLLTIWNKRN